MTNAIVTPAAMPFASTRVDRSSLSEPPDQEMTCPRRCPCTCARRCTANYTLVRYAQLLRPSKLLPYVTLLAADAEARSLPQLA